MQSLRGGVRAFKHNAGEIVSFFYDVGTTP